MLDDNENKIDELLNLIKELKEENNKRFTELELKNNCDDCKVDNYLSKEYFFNNLKDRKNYVDFCWKFVIKSLCLGIIEVLFWRQWLFYLRRVNNFFWGEGWKS